MQMVGTKNNQSKRPFLTVAKKGDNGPAVVVGAATNNADGWQKKNSRDAPGA